MIFLSNFGVIFWVIVFKEILIFGGKRCVKKNPAVCTIVVNECWILLGTITPDATEEKTHKKQHPSKDVQFSSPKT
jgi:hypothetical protein